MAPAPAFWAVGARGFTSGLANVPADIKNQISGILDSWGMR